MKVTYVGFGGIMEVPCYEDENGTLYFDENNGRNGLRLYTGAWRTECGLIDGEPNIRITEPVECDDPFVRSPREHEYMLLGRLQSDCNYFISHNGKCRRNRLWSDIETILREMEKILDSFAEDEKPEWLTDADFVKLKKEVLAVMKKVGI
jgi:hypothetical protein